MIEFRIKKRCEEHASWYCECPPPAVEPLKPIRPEPVKMAPPSSGIGWAFIRGAAVAAVFWVGLGFYPGAWLRLTESERRARQIEEIEIRMREQEKIERERFIELLRTIDTIEAQERALEKAKKDLK